MPSRARAVAGRRLPWRSARAGFRWLHRRGDEIPAGVAAWWRLAACRSCRTASTKAELPRIRSSLGRLRGPAAARRRRPSLLTPEEAAPWNSGRRPCGIRRRRRPGRSVGLAKGWSRTRENLLGGLPGARSSSRRALCPSGVAIEAGDPDNLRAERVQVEVANQLSRYRSSSTTIDLYRFWKRWPRGGSGD